MKIELAIFSSSILALNEEKLHASPAIAMHMPVCVEILLPVLVDY